MPSKRRRKSKPVESSVKDDEENDEIIEPVTEPPNSDESPKKRRRSSNGNDDDDADDDNNHENETPITPGKNLPQDPPPSHHSSPHPNNPSRNQAGKPAEAGIIEKIYVENFMCHRKHTVNLCRNVNFIHGQNGSGKSAILAAVQICLGAGAKRTHRARNLKELVRKESDAGSAKVRVTLLNKGGDAFRPDVYGDSVTVERTIALRGGYNGYKLIDQWGKEQSRSKKDLDALLDQLNIQVENPVAVLDQEEAKKFLCGKAEDKYHFFTKATELERLDRSYASVVDRIFELSDSHAKICSNMSAAKDNVQHLQAEWEKFQALDKLEDKISNLRVFFTWSLFRECHQNFLCEEERLQHFNKKGLQRQEELERADKNANVDSTEQDKLQEQLGELTAEAEQAHMQKVKLEGERKQAQQPVKQRERALKQNHRESKTAGHRLASATKDLQTARADIVRKAGSAESEERKRMENVSKAEQMMEEEKGSLDGVKKDIDNYLAKYEELESREQAAVDASTSISRQLYAVNKKLDEMKAGDGNSLAMFGPKCAAMYHKVEQAKKEGKFSGTVIGPIGKYLKIASGKENLASLAELSLGGGVFDRFIVTNDRDRSYFMRLRVDVRCNSRDCGVFQIHDGPRYAVKPPPSDDVETAASVLNIEHDLVLNCLVDNCRTDQVALMSSKDSSEKALLQNNRNNTNSIRGGNIKQVYFLPKGDFWRVTKGGQLSVFATDKKLRQSIGVDRTDAIRESERDVDHITIEKTKLNQVEKDVKKERNHYKVKWNQAQQIMNRTTKKITSLQNTIENIRAEESETVNITVETNDLEDEVRQAEGECSRFKEEEEEHKKILLDLQPGLDDIQNRLEEISARNEKVVKEILTCEHSLKEFMNNQTERTRLVGKKRKKLEQVEDAISKQTEVVQSRTGSKDDSLHKARLLTHQNNKMREAKERKAEGLEEVDVEPLSDEFLAEELKNIEPIKDDKKPEYYKTKIMRAQRDLEKERQKRNLAESNPLVAFEKFQRAEKDLDSKMEQIDRIEDTIASLKEDVRGRKERWKQFRSHIGDMTNETFDVMLNKKGSCGEIEFDHKSKQLNLTVQKDYRDEHSQTKDVKALSGGERSFTTLSLLLALGESLETPFRVMDEFDVFLDPMSRKIALDTMVQVAKGLEHRQFIFITPQDLSNLKTDPMLKIFHMKPPPRSAAVGGATQQTIDFESS